MVGSLTNLTVFSEYVYTTATETLRQQIELFNAASRGALVLNAGSSQGDYSDEVLWAKISGLVKRRNAYGSGSVTAKNLTQLVDTMVKVAAGTPPINIDPGMFKWINKSPEEAGATIGLQLAGDMLADMVNTAIMALTGALLGQTAVVTSVANNSTPVKITMRHLNTAVRPFGDKAGEIVIWLMHSLHMNDLFDNNLANSANLFSYGTVNVVQDAFGRAFIITDSPALINLNSTNPDIYYALGLTQGAVTVINNTGEYTDNVATLNGDENIARTYQAEWTYSIGLKGLSWDKTNGGKSPNDAALATGTNWDKYATDIKDLPGVILATN